ncbi:MAG TPA: YbhB/YbcL family Raf kinase inhibitor-like protein [Acidobacteriota bacterium]|nr:YbhB/YbcL family Raf kinase inhibitor-like protein [Acidobacteriota bacterium]
MDFRWTRFALFAGLCTALSLVWLQARTFPQLVLGGGFEAVLIVTNTSSEAGWTGEVRLLQENERLWTTAWLLDGVPQADGIFQVNLAAGGSRRFRLTSDLNLPRIGYLRVLAQGASSAQDLALSYFFNLRQGGELTDSTGVTDPPQTKWMRIPVEQNFPRQRTGIALAAFQSTADFDIVMRLFNSGGNQVGVEAFDYGGHLARFVDEIFDNVPDDFVGSVQIESDEGLFVTALRQELVEGGSQLTAVPPRPLAELQSAAFALGETIPEDFTCDSPSIFTPALFWSPAPPVAPQESVSYVMILDDADAGFFPLWVVYDIPAFTRHIPELNEIEQTDGFLPLGGVHGLNGFGSLGYAPPCPILGDPHRLFFRLYAIQGFLNFQPGATAAQIEAAIQGRILAAAQTMALDQ